MIGEVAPESQELFDNAKSGLVEGLFEIHAVPTVALNIPLYGYLPRLAVGACYLSPTRFATHRSH